MNQIFYSELKEMCSEIALDLNNEVKIQEVIRAYILITKLSNIARKEGLLALEDSIINQKVINDTDKYLKKLIMLVVDGTDPKLVEEVGINIVTANCLKSYDGLITLMYLYGTLMIQNGDNPRVIDEVLKSVIPDGICAKLDSLLEQRDVSKPIQQINEELIKRYTDEADEIDPKDSSIIGQLSSILVKLSNYGIQRLLREIECSDIAVAMKAMKGQARKRIFDNLSDRLAIMIAEDMEFMGPIRLKDAEDSASVILKEYKRCVDMCEITGVDEYDGE